MVDGQREQRPDSARFILQAAGELFTRHGFERTSLQAVADRAGVAKGLVAHHFGSKHGLLDAVLSEFYARQRAALTRGMDVDGDAGAATPSERRAAIVRLIDASFDFMAHEHAYPRLIQNMVARDDQVCEIAQKHLGALHGWLERRLLAWLGGVGPTAARHFIVTFSGAVIDYFAYASGLAKVWSPGGLLSEAALAERRAHLHFLVDALLLHLGRVQAEGAEP